MCSRSELCIKIKWCAPSQNIWSAMFIPPFSMMSFVPRPSSLNLLMPWRGSMLHLYDPIMVFFSSWWTSPGGLRAGVSAGSRSTNPSNKLQASSSCCMRMSSTLNFVEHKVGGSLISAKDRGWARSVLLNTLLNLNRPVHRHLPLLDAAPVRVRALAKQLKRFALVLSQARSACRLSHIPPPRTLLGS